MEVWLQFDRPYLRNLVRSRSKFTIDSNAVMHFRSNSEGTRPLAAQLYLAPPVPDPFNFVLLHIVDRIRHINAQIDKRLIYKPACETLTRGNPMTTASKYNHIAQNNSTTNVFNK